MRSGWNHSSSSSFSPTDASLIGLPVTALTESAAPPRASPSSFVRTTPSKSMRSWNACATFTASWPVIASSTSRTFVGFASRRTARELVHQRLVDVQAAGGVEDDDVAAVRARAVDPVAHGLDRVAALVGVDGNVDLRAELDQLVDRGGTLQVGGDERGLAAVLLQEQRELAGGRRLARALQAGEQDRRRRSRRERDLRRAGAHQLGQLLVHDLHDLLAGRQALLHVLRRGALAHLRDELLDDVEVDVGLEQREPDLAHRARDRLVVERPAALEVAERALQLVRERVEHRPLSVDGGLPGRTQRRGQALSRNSVTPSVTCLRDRLQSLGEQDRRRPDTAVTGPGPGSLSDERAREVVRVERAQVVELLAHADQLHRQAELVGDRDRDAALRRAVELRQRDAGDAGRLAEEPRLLDAVLARSSRRRRAASRAARRRARSRSRGAPSRAPPSGSSACAGGPRCRRSRRRGRAPAPPRSRRTRPRPGRRRARSRRSRRRRAPPRSRAAPRQRRGTCRPRRRRRSARARASFDASLPIVVVLPVPLTPTTRITRRRAGDVERRRLAEQRAISSASASPRSPSSPRASSRRTSSAVAGTPTSAWISASSSRSHARSSPGSNAATAICSVSARRDFESESRSRANRPARSASGSGAASASPSSSRPAPRHDAYAR